MPEASSLPSIDSRRLGFIFCGSGPQHIGMCRHEYEQHDSFRSAFDRCATRLERWLDAPLKDVVFGADADRLNGIRFMSASIFACQYALLQFWSTHGVAPSACLSNSLGTHAGAIAAGAIDLEEASELLRIRCELVQRWCEPGGMAVVEEPRDTVAGLLRREGIALDIAAVNSPAWTTCSGARAEIERLVRCARASGMVSRMHPISHGFHSRQMDAVRDAYQAALRWMGTRRTQLPLHSTVTVGPQQLDAEFWFAQLRQPIQFRRAYEAYRDDAPGGSVELSPDRAFGRFAQQAEAFHDTRKPVFFSMARNERERLAHCRDEVARHIDSHETHQA